jgi:predicted N-acetyltransferase YhbS
MSGHVMAAEPGAVSIRRATPGDIQRCAQICFEAFYKINTHHTFPPDMPTVDVAKGVLSMMISHPEFYCVVAESQGRVLGSNCLDERSDIAGLGPITVDPTVQNQGVGRKLMETMLDRARERNFSGVRLVQAAFHNRSLALYTNLGFVVREPLSVMQGPPLRKNISGHSVRKAVIADLPECNSLAKQIHGHDRGGELRDAVQHGTAVVVERNGRISGYCSVLGFFGHAVAVSNPDLQAMIGSAECFEGPGILVPNRNTALFRWCLDNRLRIVEPMTLMTMGVYNEPAGVWLPSILF